MQRLLYVLVAVLLAAISARAEHFDSAGVKLYYTVEGRGEPVVLVHGFAASGLVNWVLPGISKDLASDYQVITLDNRGHGRSDRPHDTTKYGPEMVEDVVRLLDHLGIKKAHIVGYSLGGFITHKLCILHPERVLTATLGGAGWLREEDPEMKLMVTALAKSLEEGRGIVPLLMRIAPSGRPKRPDEHIEALNKFVMAVNDPKALAAVIRSVPELSVSEKEVVANQVPTLAIVGSLDPLKAAVDKLKDKRPSVQVVELAGADHTTALVDRGLVRGVREFLAAHKRP